MFLKINIVYEFVTSFIVHSPGADPRPLLYSKHSFSSNAEYFPGPVFSSINLIWATQRPYFKRHISAIDIHAWLCLRQGPATGLA